MPLFKKKIPKKTPTICCQFDQTAKKTSGKEEIRSTKRMVRVFSITLQFHFLQGGILNLIYMYTPQSTTTTPLRFIVHGIFFIKSIIYQVGRSTCNITFNSQGVLSKKKKKYTYRKKDFSASSCISNSRLRTVIDIKKNVCSNSGFLIKSF